MNDVLCPRCRGVIAQTNSTSGAIVIRHDKRTMTLTEGTLTVTCKRYLEKQGYRCPEVVQLTATIPIVL